MVLYHQNHNALFQFVFFDIDHVGTAEKMKGALLITMYVLVVMMVTVAMAKPTPDELGVRKIMPSIRGEEFFPSDYRE